MNPPKVGHKEVHAKAWIGERGEDIKNTILIYKHYHGV